MILYVLRRLLVLIPVWVAAIAVAFLLVHAIPGGPFDTGALRPPEAQKILEDRYNLNDPLVSQFASYISNVVRGDLGESLVRRGLSVSDALATRIPVSVTLGVAALVVATVVGIPIGVIAAVKSNRFLDRFLMVGATMAYALPSFVLAMLLMLTFGLALGWLPLGGWGSPQHVILPAFALGLPASGLLARMSRATMLDVLPADYVRTARAIGERPARVVIAHAFPNTVATLATVIAVLAAELIVGGLVVELIFGIPGVGQLMVDSALGSDYTLTLGLIVFYVSIIFFANLIADITQGVIDPRVRLT
ncbi:MAG: ABC transporter permease [Acidimicrobiales bacterium]